MVDYFKLSYLLICIQLPVFVLTVIIYGLSLSILKNTVTSASIALSQFAGDGVSLSGIFTGVIVLGAFNLFIQIVLFIVGSMTTSWSISWSWYMLILGLMNLLFNFISEAIFFKFASCFNYPRNDIVVARSIMVILLMEIVLCYALFVIFKLYCGAGKARIDKFDALIAPLLFLPSIVMFVLNAILIDQLSPQFNFIIQPSSLKMGFFNQFEIGVIENGTSNYWINQEAIIGNLADVIYSPNKVLAHTACTTDSNGQQSCTDVYLHKYSYQIPCSDQRFYKDCANASSLTIHVTYLDSGPYPTYNCLVNQANKTCTSICTQLLSNYQLILIQEGEIYISRDVKKTKQVQPAWTGLSKCHTNIKFKLTHNSQLSPCSFALKPSVSIHFIFIGIFFCIF
jgi:hypothetical protein